MTATVGTARTGATAAGLMALLSFFAPRAVAGDYDKLAEPLARTARAHGRARLAVLPFQVVGGKGSSGGRIIAERLIGPLAATEGLEVVERTMLDGVMKEQRLQVSGVVDQHSLKELGRVLGVDAIVTGTAITLKDDRVEIVARLIDAETARVLGVAELRVERDWNESMFDDTSWAGLPQLPSFDLAQDASAAVWDCSGAGETVDSLERSITDIKARYWAQRLREGIAPSSLKANPGSEINNPEIRAEFYARLRAYSRQAGPAVDAGEVGRMNKTMDRISKVQGSCRGEGS
jgi:TolB-like protein